MPTLIFIHGTGVREAAYESTFQHLTEVFKDRRSDIILDRCFWGGKHGARLHNEGRSIPTYDTARKADGAFDSQIDHTEDDYDLAPLWNLLYQDPLFELRLLAVRYQQKEALAPGQSPPGDILRQQAESLAPLVRLHREHPDLYAELEKAGIQAFYETAHRDIIHAAPFRTAIFTAVSPLDEYRFAIARALVSRIVQLCEDASTFCPVLYDPALRDALVLEISTALGETSRGVGDWVKRQIMGLALRPSTYYFRRKRGAITDATFALPGDVLLYQARGKAIRSFIKQNIKQAEEPVILLAHSLGGIACVDLLVREALDVELLITVGSQAPFVYEINALSSLPYEHDLALDNRLPDHFPRWLNIYDLRDILSYVGRDTFGKRVTDVKVNNRQPFPYAHSAYWSNPAVWDTIIEWLP